MTPPTTTSRLLAPFRPDPLHPYRLPRATAALTLALLLLGTVLAAYAGPSHAAHGPQLRDATLTPGRVAPPATEVPRDARRPVYAEHGPTGTRLLVVEWNDGRITAHVRCKHAGSPRCWDVRRDRVRAFGRAHRIPGRWIGEPGLLLTP